MRVDQSLMARIWTVREGAARDWISFSSLASRRHSSPLQTHMYIVLSTLTAPTAVIALNKQSFENFQPVRFGLASLFVA